MLDYSLFIKSLIKKQTNKMIQTTNRDLNLMWPTQTYNNNQFSIGFTDATLYDGLLGAVIVYYYYSKYYDNTFEIIFKQLATEYSSYIHSDIYMSTSSPGHLGAYDIIGGGFFVFGIVDYEPIKDLQQKTLSKLSEISTVLLENVDKVDFIRGLPGLMKQVKLCYDHDMIGNSFVETLKQEFIKTEIDYNRLPDYAHGYLSQLDIIARWSIPVIIPSIDEISNFEFGQSKWIHSWCHGSIGLIVYLISMYKSGDNSTLSIIKNTYNRIIQDIKTNNFIPAGVCHGFLGIVDIVIFMYENSFIDKYEYAKTSKLIVSKLLYKKYYDPQLSSNGIMLGTFGVIYQLMRLQLKSKIPPLIL